jgi:ER lumen protein retaining receptor
MQSSNFLLETNIYLLLLGISLLTQLLYVLVFLTRYLDLLWVSPAFSYWNFVLKNFYIWSSIYILILMLRVYPRTREREKAWRLAIYATGGSLVAAPIMTAIFEKFVFVEMLYTFSLVLESICILPQLLLLRQTTVPTVITSFYLLLLGSYRFFYILNWIVRAASKEHWFDPVSVIFGIIQTALYVDFAWVYWTRQRVKLRGGGVVDSDDLRKSWLVGGLLGRGRPSADGAAGEFDDEEDDVEGQRIPGENVPNANGNARKSTAPSRWGKRGVSVSADDTLDEHEQTRSKQQNKNTPSTTAAAGGGTPQERAGILKQPDEFLDEDDIDDDHQPFSVGDADEITPTTSASGPQKAVLNSGDAWGSRQL